MLFGKALLVMDNSKRRASRAKEISEGDAVGRSMRHLVMQIEDLREQNIGFRSISDGLNRVLIRIKLKSEQAPE